MSLWCHTWDVGTHFDMYGKWRPLAILWYQLHVSGDFIFKFTRGKVCYKKGLVGRGLTIGSKSRRGSANFCLRVRAFFHKTVRVYHVYCNFKIGFVCRITVIFGTLKDGSLLINTLASNISFSYRNMFQNGADALSKIADAFLSKSSKFHLVWIIR